MRHSSGYRSCWAFLSSALEEAHHDPFTPPCSRRKFIAARQAQAASEGKAFIIEEFGKYVPRPADSDSDISRIRDPYFQDIFSIVNSSINTEGALRGSCSSAYAPTSVPRAVLPGMNFLRPITTWLQRLSGVPCSKFHLQRRPRVGLSTRLLPHSDMLLRPPLARVLVLTSFPCPGAAAVVMWKYGVTPYHNRTDPSWVNVQDTTWTNIVAPLGQTLNLRKTAVPNCRPGAAPSCPPAVAGVLS